MFFPLLPSLSEVVSLRHFLLQLAKEKIADFPFFSLSFACVEEEETSYFNLHNANQTVKNFETFKL